MDRFSQLKLAMVALLVAFLLPASGFAFCGFYVGGAGASMFNDATQVVLMRDGTKTVLSMQNRYTGPPTGFAMVVPVPVVLQQDDVRTLNPDIFDKVDTLTSPRLVEYWEQDPCQPQNEYDDFASPQASGGNDGSINNANNGSVTVEAEFAVGEYNIAVLSATDSGALDTWLADNNYNVPAGAGPYYQPYINAGMYFFVAQVDPTKVTFDAAGNTVLSPIRFSYDSPDFQLPVRLGMINSAGQQDLMVYVLAPDQRYELANYPNAFIPTNIEVVDAVRNNFGGFYKSLFARTLKENPGAAITEYSWAASSCDPCPGPVTLQPDDLATLGGDVLSAGNPDQFNPFGFVITRLHLRYDKDEIGEDLVFRKADPVVGGRERHNESGVLEVGATPDSINNFQARYIIRHRWNKPVLCADPVYAQWGGDPDSASPYNTPVSSATSPNTSGDSFESPDAGPIEELVREDIPEINVKASDLKGGSGGGCSSANAETAIPTGLLLLLGFVGIGVRRRQRQTK